MSATTCILGITVLFAQLEKTRPRKLDPINDIGLPLAAFAGALMVLAIVIVIMKRWYSGSRQAEEDASGLLTGLRNAVDEGEMTVEELRQIKARLAGGLAKGGRANNPSNDPPIKGGEKETKRPGRSDESDDEDDKDPDD